VSASRTPTAIIAVPEPAAPAHPALAAFTHPCVARSAYFLLLVQEKVGKEKDPPEPPTSPALLAEGGACLTAHPCAAGTCALPARTRVPRAFLRLRLRCSAAATGTQPQEHPFGRARKRDAGTAELVWFFGSPYGAPEHRKALGERPEGVARRMRATGPRDRMSRRASAGAQSRGAQEKRAIRGGLLMCRDARIPARAGGALGPGAFGFSLAAQKKVTCPGSTTQKFWCITRLAARSALPLTPATGWRHP
jgi:hypothetical protein